MQFSSKKFFFSNHRYIVGFMRHSSAIKLTNLSLLFQEIPAEPKNHNSTNLCWLEPKNHDSNPVPLIRTLHEAHAYWTYYLLPPHENDFCLPSLLAISNSSIQLNFTSISCNIRVIGLQKNNLHHIQLIWIKKLRNSTSQASTCPYRRTTIHKIRTTINAADLPIKIIEKTSQFCQFYASDQ